METLGVYWSLYGEDSIRFAVLFLGIAFGWQLKIACDRRKIRNLNRDAKGRFAKRGGERKQTWLPDEAK